MKKSSLPSFIQIIVFSAFIIVFALLFIFLPKRDFSPQENRMLQKLPDFSAEALFSGSYMEEFESYLSDQFALRDGWISLKSSFERFSGKTENNGVFFCSDDTLITRFSAPDEAKLAANINAVNTLAASCGADFYFSLIPGAVSIWADKLPANADNCDQKALINSIYSKIDAPCVDNYSALSEKKDEYIFYRTDHHWTTLGAYYGAAALLGKMGLSVKSLDDYSPKTLSDEFFGTVYSSSGVRWVRPDTITAYVPDEGISVTNYSSGEAAPGLVYDMDKLSVKDKYAVFFGGNTPLLKIETPNASLPRLLVIRDSYSDCELPFLFDSFSEIYVVDLRYYKLGISKLIKENSIDTVVFNYALSNFVSDTSVTLAAG
jgi:hypothetical protein